MATEKLRLIVDDSDLLQSLKKIDEALGVSEELQSEKGGVSVDEILKKLGEADLLFDEVQEKADTTQRFLTDFATQAPGFQEFHRFTEQLEELGGVDNIPYLYFTIRRLTAQIPGLRDLVYWSGQARLTKRLMGPGGIGTWIAGILLGYNLLIAAQRIMRDIERRQEENRQLIMGYRGFTSRVDVENFIAEQKRASQQLMKGYA